MTKRAIFILCIFSLAMIVGGFFIFRNISLAADSNLIHDGIKNNHLDWEYNNVTTSVERLVFITSSSTLITPNLDLTSCLSARLEYSIQTYNGTGTSSKFEISVNSNLVDSKQPLSSAWLTTSTDLTSYCGQNINVQFATPYATGSKGAGLDNISFSATYPITNQAPTAIATSSLTNADIGEDIFFDGSNSTDTDGFIDQWFWNLAGTLKNTATATYNFDSTGIKNIQFWVIDNEGATSSILEWPIYISSSTATTSPTINPNDIVINEIYPAPNTGEDEWVELYNNTSSTIDLSGILLLNIDGGKYVTTTLTGTINSNEYKIIDNITGSLNNDGDTVILRDDDKIINQTTYGDYTNKKGESWARNSLNVFEETITPTKNALNIITPKPASSSGGSGGSTYTPKIDQDTTTTTIATSTTATSTTINFAGKIIINEILPDPSDGSENEFIELKNISSETIDVAGLYLKDNSKLKYILKSSTSTNTILQPQEFLVIKKNSSKLALNNTGFEAVNLFDHENELIDRITYEAAKIKGQAYAKNTKGEWLWTNFPTPGSENVFNDSENQDQLAQIITAAKTAVKVASAKSNGANYGLVEMEKIPELPANSKLTVRAIVSVLPGVLGSQYFYIAGSGIQVYSYKKDFPDLKIGDYVEVTGVLSDTTSGRRIKTTTKADIKFIEHRDPPTPHQIALMDLEDYESNLIEASGTILQISGRNIIIDEDGTEAKIYINNSIEFKDIGAKPSDKINVIGIVGKTSAGLRIMPRDLADIKLTKGDVKGEFEQSPAKSNFNSPYWYFGAIIFFLAALSGFLFFKLNQNKNIPN